MICNIFPTEAQANLSQEQDFAEWKGDKTGEYWDTTTAWATPMPRVTDGKWYYPVCPGSSAVYTTEVFDPEWLPVSEDI